MPIFRGTNNISKIFRGNTEIVKAFRGVNLIFQSGEPQYELIADVNVTTNTTQIDFDNLNITKDDELRLVYTLVGSSSTNFTNCALFVNNNNTASNYFRQRLIGFGSTLSASRNNINYFGGARSNKKISGFADIKISNNDRYVFQSQFINGIGAESSAVDNVNENVVGTFTITSITKLSVVAFSEQIAVGSRLQLYKVVR